MRYYKLVLRDPTSGNVWAPTAAGTLVKTPSAQYSFTSHPTGVNKPPDPGALDVEFDLPVAPLHTAQTGSIIRIWGVGLKMLGHAADLNGANFELYGGMGTGIAAYQGLAQPKQSGLLLQGQVFQGLGSWEGVNQTLDLVLNPGDLTPQNGIGFQWKAGQSLAGALFTALSQAFPAFKVKIDISDNLLTQRGEDQTYFGRSSFESFAEWLLEFTQPIGAKVTGNTAYPGVSLWIKAATIYAGDGTQLPAKSTQLNFWDLVGQPTWLDPTTISFKTILRADINIGDQIVFPSALSPPYTLVTPAAAFPSAPARSSTIFKGAFKVIELHHFAHFRQGDGNAWVTSFSATPMLTGPTPPP